MQDEFYVGYQPEAPPGLGRWLRGVVLALILLGAVVALAVTAAQSPFPPAVFEFGTVRTFEGVVAAGAHPLLHVDRPGAAAGGGVSPVSVYALVGPGKHGPPAEVAAAAGSRVRLDGTLVYHEGRTLLEVVPGSLETLSTEASTVPPQPLARRTFVGEIVDSKCYLGVMNPGRSKPHRACAARCISGGIPPLFLTRDTDGRPLHLLLVDDDGAAVNEAVLPFVAEPLRIGGRVERHGDFLFLKADPSTYERVAP